MRDLHDPIHAGRSGAICELCHSALVGATPQCLPQDRIHEEPAEQAAPGWSLSATQDRMRQLASPALSRHAILHSDPRLSAAGRAIGQRHGPPAQCAHAACRLWAREPVALPRTTLP
jgi:hypothetical protein